MTDRELGWLAGIIEGEGAIFIMEEKNCIRVSVRMTDKDVIEKLRQVTRIGTIAGPIPPYGSSAKKDRWQWTVNHQSDVAGLIMMLYPLFSERRKGQVEECLAAWRSKPARRRTVFHNQPPPGRPLKDEVFISGRIVTR